MTVGELVAFNFYVALLVWPLRTIGMTLAWGQRAAAALERVHEVLRTVPDIRDPAQPVAPAGRRTARRGHVPRRDVRLPRRRRDRPAGARRLHTRAGGRRVGRARRRDGVGQVDGRPAAAALLRPPARRRRDRRRRRARRRGPRRATRRRGGVRGHVAVPRHGRRQHRLRRPDRRPPTHRGRGATGRRPRLRGGAAGGLRHVDRRAWLLAVGRPTSADRDRQGDRGRPADPRARRRDECRRPVEGTRDPRRDADRDARSHHDRHRPPARHDRHRRHGGAARRRVAWPPRGPTANCSPPTRAIATCSRRWTESVSRPTVASASRRWREATD